MARARQTSTPEFKAAVVFTSLLTAWLAHRPGAPDYHSTEPIR